MPTENQQVGMPLAAAMPVIALVLASICTRLATVSAHGDVKEWPINPVLGVSGFPDCVRMHPELQLTMEEASFDLRCAQKPAPKAALKVACVGDSITAGVHSTGGNHTYPFQLQMMLDAAHGWGAYSVTNLGACGSTMLRKGDSPYWKRPQYQALIASKWDVVTIMLGTNDAKDPGSGGPNDWQHDCGGADHTTIKGCTFAQDFQAMVDVVRKIGTTAAGPDIYALVPPPLMAPRAYGMNQSVINSVLPKLVPLIQKSASTKGPIDIYSAMGGVKDWQSENPPRCTLNSTWAPCAWWCDAQSCDQCHPNNNGYAHLAAALLKGLDFSPTPPAPTPPGPSPRGVWLYENQGSGRLFLHEANFTANFHSNRSGALGWDACRPGGNFDNGHAIFGKPGGIGSILISGDWAIRGAFPCMRTFSYPNSTQYPLSQPYTATDGIRYEGFAYLEVA